MENTVIKMVSDWDRGIPREQQLSVILSLAMEMLEKAKNKDWESVIRLESRRTALIGDFFAVPIADHEVAAVAHYINKILESDKHLIELSDEECHYLRENLQNLNQGKRALKLYNTDRY